MLVEFSIVPIGSGESLSGIVAEAVKVARSSGLPCELTPMGTIIEGNWDETMSVVRQAHMRVMELSPRVLTTIRIDDRKSATDAIHVKVRSVEERLKGVD